MSSINEQEDPNMNMSDPEYDQDSFSPLESTSINEANVPDQDMYLSQNEQTVQTEVTVPDHETSEGSAPEISLTDEDLNYLDDFFEEIGAVGANVNVGESSDTP